MTIVEKARQFIEAECKKPTSIFGYGPYIEHYVPMAQHCRRLARKLGGDIEVILIAAWLHDIGSIMVGRKDHHITSAKIAKQFLAENNYDKEKTKLVLDCIKHHRQSTNLERKTLEEKIVADADAICNFDMLPGLFYGTLVVEKLTPVQASKSIKKKFENKWERLHFKESKELARPKYKAAMLLLREICKLQNYY